MSRSWEGELDFIVTFARDLDASDTIDLESWEHRPLAFRFKEWMARLWARLL